MEAFVKTRKPFAAYGSVAGASAGALIDDKKKRNIALGAAAGAGSLYMATELDADRRAVKGLHKADTYNFGKGTKGYLKTLLKYTKQRIPTGATYAGIAFAPAASLFAASKVRDLMDKSKSKK